MGSSAGWGRAMSVDEQRVHDVDVSFVRDALQAVESVSEGAALNESLAMARARLEDWLDENEGRWTT